MSSSTGWIWSEEHKDYYRYDSVTKEYTWARNTLSSKSEASRTDTSVSDARKITSTSTKPDEAEDIEMTEDDPDDASSDDEPETIKSRSPTVAPKERSLHGRSTPSHSLSPAHATSPFQSPATLEQPQPMPVPAGWVAQWDSMSSKYYYVNASTGESRWNRPEPVSTSTTIETTPTQSTGPYDRFKDKSTEIPGLSSTRTSSLGGFSLNTLLSGGTDTSKKGIGSERSTDQPNSPTLGSGTQSPTAQGLGSDARNSELADTLSGRTKNEISGYRSGTGARIDSIIGPAQGAGIESRIGYLASSGIVPGHSESSRFEEEKKVAPGYGPRTEPSVDPTGISSSEKRTEYGQGHNYPQPGGQPWVLLLPHPNKITDRETKSTQGNREATYHPIMSRTGIQPFKLQIREVFLKTKTPIFMNVQVVSRRTKAIQILLTIQGTTQDQTIPRMLTKASKDPTDLTDTKLDMEVQHHQPTLTIEAN